MDNLKKIGLSALAGSLVAFSAHAGEMSVSGSAKFTYTADTGNEDNASDGDRFGLGQAITFSGSGEMDNGHTVSLTHVISTNGGAKSTSVLSYDMGELGTLRYQQDSGALGIGVIDDITPTADEEVWNGLDADSHSDGSEDLNGRVGGGVTGFNYTYSMDMVTINAGYAPKDHGTSTADGANGNGTLKSAMGVAVQVTPMDGLNIYAGLGERGNANGFNSDDHETLGVTYAYGPVTVGYQVSEIDDGTTSATEDEETDAYSIAFAVNDNLSISYGERETEREGQTLDQEVKGFSIGYSMGSMTLKAHQNEVKNIAQTADRESEHTEIALTFAF